MTQIIVQGTTEPLDFQLFNNGQPLNGASLTLALEIYNPRTGTAITSPPTVAWLDEPTGKVRVTGAGTLALGSYAVRYKLTDVSAKFGYAPNQEQADVWKVVKVPAGP